MVDYLGLAHGFNFHFGCISPNEGVNTFMTAITSPGNARTLLFSALIGAIITLTQASGGMEGFINWVEQRQLGKSRRTVRLFGIGTSMVLFLESNFGLLVAGLLEQAKGASRAGWSLRLFE